MVTKAKAVQFGCGPIGCSVVRYVCQRADIELVGAIARTHNIGRDLGEVAGLDKKRCISHRDSQPRGGYKRRHPW